MENSRIYTIDEKECLGDSLTFINTNFKILDILACNLKANTLDFVNNSTRNNSENHCKHYRNDEPISFFTRHNTLNFACFVS